MCGISGIANLNGTVSDLPQHIQRMTDAIRHRGPDGEGFLFCSGEEIISAFGNDTPEAVIHSSFKYSPQKNIKDVSGNFLFTLGHRRLSIIDVSPAGHQPMCSFDKKFWIVFNGEIYNYLELREELQQKGFSFHTNTDTEVILAAYQHWDKDCVKHFNGMWAFVIFDEQKNILFGSRDRFGVKPFYYYRDENVFAFASEQKALLKLPFVKSGIRFSFASDFLAGNIEFIEHGEENFFRNIFELLPSYCFRFDLSTKHFQRWSYFSLHYKNSLGKFKEEKFHKYKDETERLLFDSVKLRLRSDVPVGSCLSGGIDSSAIVGTMDELIRAGYEVNLGGRLKLFTLKFDEPEIDESRWAKLVVDKTKAEWHTVTPTADEFLKDLETLNYCQDVPVCSSGTYGQFRLMKQAKESGIKVILDGQGGDELFAGYLPYSFVQWNELAKKFRAGKLLQEISSEGKLFFNLRQWTKTSAKKSIANILPMQMQQAIFTSYFSHYEYLNKDLVHEYFKRQSYIFNRHPSTLNEALQKDFVNYRLKMYLKYEDRSSMWHSVEARTPFADDHPLIEYVFQIPGCYKIHKGIHKFLLREATKKMLPKEIKERKDKKGFVTPMAEWMNQINKNQLDYFDDSRNDFINVKKIKKDYKKIFSPKDVPSAVRAFKLISFAVWKKTFRL